MELRGFVEPVLDDEVNNIIRGGFAYADRFDSIQRLHKDDLVPCKDDRQPDGSIDRSQLPSRSVVRFSDPCSEIHRGNLLRAAATRNRICYLLL